MMMLKPFAIAVLMSATLLATMGLSSSTSLARAIDDHVPGVVVPIESRGVSTSDPHAPDHAQMLAFVAGGRGAAVSRRGGHAHHGRSGYAHRGGAAVGARGGYAHRGGVAVGPRGAVAHRGAVAVGPRGGVAYRGSTVVVRNPVLVGGVYRPYGATWRPGAAVAAGAA